MIVVIIALAFVVLFNIFIRSGGKHDSWTHVFNDGDPQTLYLETTNGFKSRISPKEWEKLVKDWRERLGPWKKTKILGFDSYNGDEFPDKLTKSDGAFNTVQWKKLKVIGSNGVAYITSYRYHIENVLRLNSFEIEFEVKQTESYLVQEDVRFVEENDY